MKSELLRLSILVGLAASACDPSIDEYEPRSGLIRGSLVYPDGVARGHTMVLLFAADDPPPPEGSGSPVNFVVVPKSALFGSAPDDEVRDFSTTFTIPTVAAGRYVIRAFLDSDGDFEPTFDLLAQPSAGDVGGGLVSLSSGEFESIEVQNDRITEGVVVTLGRLIPFERPAFAWKSETHLSVPLTAPTTVVMESHPISSSHLSMDAKRTSFLIQYIDAEGDGIPDDQNGDHLADVYPRVILRRVTPEPKNVIVPLITNPLPFLDRLDRGEVVATTTLELIVPPVAVELGPLGERTILESIPAGAYETIVISGTGQTWQVPNALAELNPTEPADPSQLQLFEMTGGENPAAGKVSGSVVRSADAHGDAFIFAFRADDPPPPAGTGRPVSALRVPDQAFDAAGRASYELKGLTDGRYLVRGLIDSDGDFSLLVPVLQQPSAGDFVGGAPGAIEVRGEASVDVPIDTQLAFERPSFAITSTAAIPANLTPQSLVLSAHPVLRATPDRVRFPVTLGSSDEDGDGFRDLYPRILLTKIEDGDPRGAANAPGPIVIPGIVDPMSFISRLAAGAPAVVVDQLPLILPPVAIDVVTGAQLRPAPPGRYRVNLISGTGQTWSVPSDLDVVFARVGTPLEDPTQAEFVNVTPVSVPDGKIHGTITFQSPPADPVHSVVIFAFSVTALPPPRGQGRPVASAIVSGSSNSFELKGLSTGTYIVRAFYDANGNFTPWYDATNQPDSGDWVGGVLTSAGELEPIAVDALTSGSEADITITSQPAPFDRPVFRFVGTPTVSVARGPGRVRLGSVASDSDVLKANGRFVIQWFDRDGDGLADDVDGDGRPNVTPLVVAESVEDPRIKLSGIIDPRQFLGFPALDPTATGSVAVTSSMDVVFPPVTRDPTSGQLGPAPTGAYRVTVVSGSGQTWTVPNELSRAVGDPIAESQSAHLEVIE